MGCAMPVDTWHGMTDAVPLCAMPIPELGTKGRDSVGMADSEANPLHALIHHKLYILRSDKSYKAGTNAEVRYTAGTRERIHRRGYGQGFRPTATHR